MTYFRSDMLVCPRQTGAWVRRLERDAWSGEDGERRIACGYTAESARVLIVHLIATHGLPLATARAVAAELAR